MNFFKEYSETNENGDTKNMVIPILFEIALAGILLIKNSQAAFQYLYALIPLLLCTSFAGTYVYNRFGDMKMFAAMMMLAALGCALQVYIDQVYHPAGTFSILKLLIGLLAAVLFVAFYSVFRRILNTSVMVYIMMLLCAAIYLILMRYGMDPNGYGTYAWIQIGGHTVQMTDITKVSAVLFYAALFSSSAGRSDYQVLFLSNFYFLINLAGSIMIHELGSFFILFFLHLSILYIFMQKGRVKKIYLLTIFALAVIALIIAFIAYHLLVNKAADGTLNSLQSFIWPYVKKIYERFSVTANIEADPYGTGYQLMQGKKALWMAGLFGNTVNFHAIPIPESDMAFIALVSAFGHVFGALTIFLFLVILLRGSELSRNLLNDNVQDSVVVYGATVLIFMQAMIVILGSCNLIPFTGLPIPFLSRGGTYQAIVMCFCGLLLHMSEKKEDRKEEEEDGSQPDEESLEATDQDR